LLFFFHLSFVDYGRDIFKSRGLIHPLIFDAHRSHHTANVVQYKFPFFFPFKVNGGSSSFRYIFYLKRRNKQTTKKNRIIINNKIEKNTKKWNSKLFFVGWWANNAASTKWPYGRFGGTYLLYGRRFCFYNVWLDVRISYFLIHPFQTEKKWPITISDHFAHLYFRLFNFAL
jgi:hypothetical protein